MQAARAQSGEQGTDQLADLPIEDLLSLRVETVYAASRLMQELSRAPASVTIVSAEEIRRHGYRTLTDVLRSVRGLYVSNDRNYEYVGVRGFARPGDYNSRILLLVDGHRLNDTIYDSAPLGAESPIDVAIVDRVEVIRGPSSSVYGSTAFFAVVNVVTRTGTSLGGIEVEGGVGARGLRHGRFTAGGRRSDGPDGLLSIGAFHTDGADAIYFPEFDLGSGGDGVARGLDADSRVTVFGSATAGVLEVQGGFGSREKTVPTAPWDTIFGDPNTRLRDSRFFVDAQVSRQFRGATLSLRAGHDRYWYEGTFAYDSGLVVDDARGAWTTGEAGIVKWFSRHRLSAGVEFRENHRQDQIVRDPESVLIDDRRSARTAALYVEDEVQIGSRVALTGGIRWDQYFESFGGTVNPRVALIVTPVDGSVFKVLHGRAFRAPNPFERYYSQDPLSLGLEPERIATSEFVWEQRLATRMRVGLSAFQSLVSDLITQRSGSEVSIDGLYFANHPDVVRTRGLEFGVEGDLPGRLYARGAWVVQRGTGRPTGDTISNSPRQLATFVVDAPVGRTGLHAALDGFFVGRRMTVHGTEVDTALVSNVTLSSPIRSGRFEWALLARNLFDVEYGDPGAEEHRQVTIPQDGRTLAVRLTWRP